VVARVRHPGAVERALRLHVLRIGGSYGESLYNTGHAELQRVKLASALLRGALIVEAAALACVMVGRQRFGALVTRDVKALYSNPGPGVGPEEVAARRAALPEPVQRYLRYALRDATPELRTVRILHGGSFRTKPDAPWSPIEGEEYFTVGKPGFVWAARMEASRFLWIGVRDRVIDGHGNMLVKLYSAFTVVDATGPEMDEGSRMRWLAETMWFPSALAGKGIGWEAIDAHSARATLLDGGLPVSVVFDFDDEGKISGLHAQRYYDAGGGRFVLMPWLGRAADYRELGGIRVPTSVEVAWGLASGEFTYARFHVTALEANIPERF
jgi:hypothetical protein